MALLYEDDARPATQYMSRSFEARMRLYNAAVGQCLSKRALLPQPQSFGLSTFDVCFDSTWRVGIPRQS